VVGGNELVMSTPVCWYRWCVQTLVVPSGRTAFPPYPWPTSAAFASPGLQDPWESACWRLCARYYTAPPHCVYTACDPRMLGVYAMDADHQVEPSTVLAPLGAAVGILGLVWYVAWVQPLPQSRMQIHWMNQPCVRISRTRDVLQTAYGGPAEKGQHLYSGPRKLDQERGWR
jgi:hypothetical protein